MTGHLISEYSSALSIVQKTFREKAIEIYKENLSLDFYYADLSSNRQEKNTGADFGIIFHINLPDYPDAVRTAVFQAKKFNKRAAIDTAQCSQLNHRYGDNGANYCFYDMETQATSSPMVIHASSIEQFCEFNSTKSFPRKDICDDGIPLSLFLVWDMLIGNDSRRYKTHDHVWNATEYLGCRQSYSKNNTVVQSPRPSKVFMVSVGGLATARNQEITDWSSLCDFADFNDE
ncbi:MAG: hypothetical protein ACRC46_03565 [Thermoguttaceae bacterium]